MAHARRSEMWNHTSHILAILHNIFRDSKTTAAIDAVQLHPYANDDPGGVGLANALARASLLPPDKRERVIAKLMAA
jgi:hypothetical protein